MHEAVIIMEPGTILNNQDECLVPNLEIKEGMNECRGKVEAREERIRVQRQEHEKTSGHDEQKRSKKMNQQEPVSRTKRARTSTKTLAHREKHQYNGHTSPRHPTVILGPSAKRGSPGPT